MINELIDFLQNSPSPYHATENAKAFLLDRGFTPLSETEDWALCGGGKYFVERGGCGFIAFTVGTLDTFSYKIGLAHTDSPALKLKENAVMTTGGYATLNTEPYGGGIWYSFFDRPLKVAGRVIVKEGNALKAKTVLSPYTLTIPSVAIHQNRQVNEGFAVNLQIDLQALVGRAGATMQGLLAPLTEGEVVAHDLYLVNADAPFFSGLSDEYLSSPRVDNLTSVCALLEGLTSGGERSGVSVIACLDDEETGSLSPQGADSDFLENTLRRVAYALRFDDNEYYKALAGSFLLSVDNAHAVHPNHPEKSDPTNKTCLGGGIVIKSHADRSYISDARSIAVLKTVFGNAEVPYQTFFNRSDMKSGSTLGKLAQRHVGALGADIGIAQLAMHSACESFAKADYMHLANGLSAFFSSNLAFDGNDITVE